MIPEDRRNAIKEYIEKEGAVSVDHLALHFGVSSMTIRRDIDKLQNMDQIRKYHGGVKAVSPLEKERNVSDRLTVNIEEKNRIAKKCKGLVEPGSVVYLDAGTTTMCIAKELQDVGDLTYFTNDVYIATYLLERGCRVFILGGFIQNSSGSVISHFATEMLKSIHFDIAFIGTAAIGKDWSSYTPTADKVYLRKTVIENSNTSYLVSDNTKFGVQAAFKINYLSDYSAVVTDYQFSEDEQKEIEELGISVIQA
ncbi:MAG: DeoR/GlpR family DNA-binding transcription regulator [Candidatus Ornithospirochaeta sp.]